MPVRPIMNVNVQNLRSFNQNSGLKKQSISFKAIEKKEEVDKTPTMNKPMSKKTADFLGAIVKSYHPYLLASLISSIIGCEKLEEARVLANRENGVQIIIEDKKGKATKGPQFVIDNSDVIRALKSDIELKNAFTQKIIKKTSQEAFTELVKNVGELNLTSEENKKLLSDVEKEIDKASKFLLNPYDSRKTPELISKAKEKAVEFAKIMTDDKKSDDEKIEEFSKVFNEKDSNRINGGLLYSIAGLFLCIVGCIASSKTPKEKASKLLLVFCGCATVLFGCANIAMPCFNHLDQAKAMKANIDAAKTITDVSKPNSWTILDTMPKAEELNASQK